MEVMKQVRKENGWIKNNYHLFRNKSPGYAMHNGKSRGIDHGDLDRQQNNRVFNRKKVTTVLELAECFVCTKRLFTKTYTYLRNRGS